MPVKVKKPEKTMRGDRPPRRRVANRRMKACRRKPSVRRPDEGRRPSGLPPIHERNRKQRRSEAAGRRPRRPSMSRPSQISAVAHRLDHPIRRALPLQGGDCRNRPRVRRRRRDRPTAANRYLNSYSGRKTDGRCITELGWFNAKPSLRSSLAAVR